jgi:Glyoxalase-like domain
VTGSQVRWVSASIDVPPELVDRARTFWTSVTASTVGSPAGDDKEFLPLDPPDADPCLWLQRTQGGPVRCHVDLYVADVDDLARRAVELGATKVRATDGLVVLASPAGLPFCLVTHREQAVRPGPAGPDGARSVVDQVCLDIPPRRFDGECDFWAALTGWPRTQQEQHDEFNRLVRPPGIPYAFLLQRLDDDQPTASAHLDLACEDRDSTAAQQRAWGADVVRRTPGWTVMRDPVGLTYCNTTRRPGAV